MHVGMEIEDEMHFMLDCDVYDDLRERVLDVYSQALAKQRKETATQTKLDIQKMRRGRRKLLVLLAMQHQQTND